MRSHAVLALAVCAGLSCGGQSQPRISTPSPPGTISRGDWTLVWSDEFDGPSGSSFDDTKWRPDTADGCSSGICGWGNQEKEYYRIETENISLDGSGRLTIVARVAPAGLTCYYGPCRYTSAKITTREKHNAGPGLVEARIKLPTGQGLWPAFWMLGSNFPATSWPQCGELDIMENRGSQPEVTSFAIHGPGYSGNTPFVRSTPVTQGEFHVYSVAWNSTDIRFFRDDTLRYVVSRAEVEARGNWVFDQPFFMILNLAVGGHFDGDPQSDAILPATLLVDYVRVYAPSSP